MDRAGRSELLKTIEAQQEKISKYEKKLRDLVLAYRGMAKEKEALEASVTALSVRQSAPVVNSLTTDGKSDLGMDVEDGGSSSETASEAGSDVDFNHLREQLATLAASLATMTQEKSKMEANYLAEKKTLRQELRDTKEELDEEREKSEASSTEMQEEIQEWRNRLRSLQHEREREQDDQAMMLKELQKLVATERMAREQAEQQLDEAKQSLTERNNVPDVSVAYEDKLTTLKRELKAIKESLKAAQEKALLPTPEFVRLQQETADMKAQNRIVVSQEQQRVREVEHRLKTVSEQAENRVSSLEAKISELSDELGNCERMRCQDQQAIAKLRERVIQLDMENTALARAAHCSPPGSEVGAADSGAGSDGGSGGGGGPQEIQGIVDQMVRLKGQLKLANERAEKPVDVEALLKGDIGLSAGEGIHMKCQDELQMVREEFERYKLRAQSVLKSKSTKDVAPNKEVEQLQGQVSDLKDRLRQLRLDYEDQESKLLEKERGFGQALEGLQDQHRLEVSRLTADHKQRLAELELEIRRHRDRTIALLSEKDRELESMRAKSPDKQLDSPYAYQTYRQMSPPPDLGGAASGVGASSEESAVSQLLARNTLFSGSAGGGGGGGGPGETALLHFAQEQARREVELQNLRKHKHGLEMALRDLQHSSTLKQQQAQEKADYLAEEIRKHERDKSRESANLEYLKNVVYHFMVTPDTLAKQQTLNAISTILQFSPKEIECVHTELNKGWFGGQGRPPHKKFPSTRI